MRSPLVLAPVLLLAACGTSGGLDRNRPDEFNVARQAPLVIPPDYALVPPQPGAARTGEVEASGQALEAMFGGPAPRSPGEAATIGAAGRDRATPGIRSQVGDARTDIVDKGTLTSQIVTAPESDSEVARTAPQ